MFVRFTPSASCGRQGRKGLTLMELVVVLAVIAALAAIVIPLFPNLLRRAHKATDCTQTNEMSKLIQLYQALYIGYPDGFDALTDGTTTEPKYLPGQSSAAGTFGGFTTIGTLSATQIDALNKVGIVNVALLAGGAGATNTSGPEWSPTMWPYDNTVTPNPTPITTGTNLRFLNRTAVTAAQSPFLASILASDTTAQFVVFGVGPKCSMVGRNIQDAPTSVPQESGFTPANTYCRVGVVFQISGVAVANGDNRALFVCACALEDDELESTEKDIVGYYQVAQKP